MQPFSYQSVKDVHGAIAAMATTPRAAFIAGGTNLIDLMKLHVEHPEALIDINKLPLNKIEKQGETLYIGALALNSDVAHNQNVKGSYPLLSAALLAGASPQLRNMATVGGNLLQKTRCPYFNDISFPCNKRDPGSGCPAIAGINRMHAVLGVSSKCIAAHPSDMAVALSALDAKVHIAGLKGKEVVKRFVPVRKFHLEPGETPEKETVLEAGELILGVEMPPAIDAQKTSYIKIRDRASYAFALVSAAVLIVIDGGTIKTARLSLGGVGTKPWHADAAEGFLTGARASGETFEKAADLALKDATPQKFNGFKIELAKKAIRQALEEASGLKT